TGVQTCALPISGEPPAQEVTMHDDGSTAARPSVDRTRPLGVLAGFDGSDQAQRALLYAARAAQRLDVRLTVVTAYTVPALAYSDASQIPTVPAEVARLSAAQDVLDAANALLDGYPGEVDLRTEHGEIGRASCRERV